MNYNLIGPAFIVLGVVLWFIGTTAPPKPEQSQSFEIEKHHIVLKKHKKIGTVNVWYGCSQSTRVEVKEYSSNFIELIIHGRHFTLITAIYGSIDTFTLEVGKHDAFLMNNGSPVAAAYVHGSYMFENVKEIYSFELYKTKLERVLK